MNLIGARLACLSILVGAALVGGGCGIHLKARSSYWSKVPATTEDLVAAKDRITQSKLSDANKAAATTRLQVLFSHKASLDTYAKAVDEAVATNQNRDDNYSIAGGLVGGVGSLSSVAILAAPVAVVAPAVAGVWNFVGLLIQQQSVQPALAKARADQKDTRVMQTRLVAARTLFDRMTTAVDQTTADAQFLLWVEVVDKINDEAALFFGVTPGPFNSGDPP